MEEGTNKVGWIAVGILIVAAGWAVWAEGGTLNNWFDALVAHLTTTYDPTPATGG